MIRRNEGEPQNGEIPTKTKKKTVELISTNRRRGNGLEVMVTAGTIFSSTMRTARRAGALVHTGRRGIYR